MQFLGLISYSLYLWQQLFTAPPVDYGNVGWLLFCPLMIAFAVLSYYLIERPCARFAKRLGHVGVRHRTGVATLDAQPRVRSAG
jgi:peptidoglycan/LPS O-acetylase OafA/YrhL